MLPLRQPCGPPPPHHKLMGRMFEGEGRVATGWKQRIDPWRMGLPLPGRSSGSSLVLPNDLHWGGGAGGARDGGVKCDQPRPVLA